MTIHVTVETCQGVIAEVAAYQTQAFARKAEQKWLKEHDIQDEQDREAKSQSGTEFHLAECRLRT